MTETFQKQHDIIQFSQTTISDSEPPSHPNQKLEQSYSNIFDSTEETDDADPYNNHPYDYNFPQEEEENDIFQFASSHKFYQNTDPKQLYSTMKRDIEKISIVSNLSFGQSFQVLKENNFDFMKSLKNYQKSLKNTEQIPLNEECPVCFTELNEENKISLKCSHFACKSCYQAYIKAQIDQIGSQVLLKTCIQEGCNEILDPSVFSILDSSSQQKIDQFYQNFAIESQKSVIYCPNTSCQSLIISYQENHNKNQLNSIMCQKCKLIFCISCKKEAHYPLNCDQMTQVQKQILGMEQQLQIQNENLSAKWIQFNTKPCPNCKVQIQKNNGCQHMTCKNCHHHFCWKCLGPWSTHNNYYVCVEPQQQQEQQQIEIKEQDVFEEKYLYYKLKIDNFPAQMKKTLNQSQNFLNLYGQSQEIYFFYNLLDFLQEIQLILAYCYIHCKYLNEPKQELLKFQLQFAEEQLETIRNTLKYSNINTFFDFHLKTFNKLYNEWKIQVLYIKEILQKYIQSIIKQSKQFTEEDQQWYQQQQIQNQTEEEEQYLLNEQFQEYTEQLFLEQAQEIPYCIACNIEFQSENCGLCQTCYFQQVEQYTDIYQERVHQ